MKSITRLILCLATGLLWLSACSYPAPTLTPSPEPNATAPAQASTSTLINASPTVNLTPNEPAAQEQTLAAIHFQDLQIRFWHSWNGAARQVIEAWVATFNRENEWGIQVEAVAYPGWDALYQAVEAGFEDQGAPDLVTAYLYQALTWDTGGSSQGWVVDLDPYLHNPAYGLANETAQIVPVFFAEKDVSHKRMGLPIQGYAQVLFYNQSWARELGFDQAPATPEQFQVQACAAASANRMLRGDGSGGWVISTQPDAMLGWVQAFGAQVIQAKVTGAIDQAASPYAFDTPPVQQAFTFLRNLYDLGCAWLSVNSLPAAEFAARRALFITGSVSEIPYLERAFQQAGSDDQWTALPFPSPLGAPVVPVYGPSLVILRSDTDRQLASWLFLRWLYTGASVTARQVQFVEATGALPAWQPAYESLHSYRQAHPAWGAVADFIPTLALQEPRLASWRYVRWAVYDAATQLFRSYFTVEQVPELTRLLDQTAADLHRDPMIDRINLLPTATSPIATSEP